jgi:hypothetical protein
MKIRAALLVLLLFPLSVSTVLAQASRTGSPYLFVWSGDSDGKDSDFLAVVDARPRSSTYGEIVATLPVGANS